MSGSWEYAVPSVLVWIPTRGLVPTKWAFGLRDLRLPPGSDAQSVAGLPYDHARNQGVRECLSRGFQWLMYLDDDVFPPSDAVLRLIAREKDIVSGLYYRRADPIVPVAMKGVPTLAWLTEFTPGAFIEVDAVGAGCLLIHSRVLKAIKPPWFEWNSEREDLPPAQRDGEDINFSRKAKRAGFSVWLDTSIACEHIGLGAAKNGKFGPL